MELTRRPDGSAVLITDFGADGWCRRLEVEAIIHEAQSGFHDVLIADLAGLGRALFLDGDLQSAALDEADYHRALVHPAMLAHGAARRVLIAGGGEGATAREVLRHRSVSEVVMVDIDPAVTAAARAHLPSWGAEAWADPRLSVVHADVFRWLAAPRGPFDVMILDLTDDAFAQVAAGGHWPALAAALTPGGVVASQCGELDASRPARFLREWACFREHLPDATPYARWITSFDSLWGFITSRPPPPGAGLPGAFAPGAWASRARCGRSTR